jgi:hypothetical protein
VLPDQNLKRLKQAAREVGGREMPKVGDDGKIPELGKALSPGFQNGC